MAILTELARRGLSHPNTVSFVKRAVSAQNGEGEKIEMPTWGIVLIYVSFMVSVVFATLVNYTLKEVVTTLCMIESPVAAITVSPSTHESGDKEEKEGLLESGPTITLVNQKPITSSIRGTIKHLVANAGRLARFRGFGSHVIYALGFSLVTEFFAAALPRVPGQAIFVAGLSGAALANIHATWTHKVVAMPTEKSYWQRVPGKSNWKTLALPAAIEAAMPYVSIYITCGFAMLMGLHKLDQENLGEYNGGQWTWLVVRMVSIVVLAITCTLFLCLPAIVTLIRIEASILPEDQDTIVPFDRTFGGKVVSKVVGGTGVVGFLDAWRSFNWEARRRLIKLFVKVFFIIFALIFVIVHVLAFEIFAIMGPALGKFLAQAKHDGILVAN
ncbi:uncharacterized protein K460DRAFT_283468 [Cucurbitaria berberidis CBS 394.84]|uniref:Ubiquitin carrier protein n=1 Tax=Cucurbitaria berberidis CBS 394.84 TaxID=1168544 RepID=A0A9P4L7L8_9PLEO|nr:uncharacterized protein K460DRAFT_283468 [Cucurbitaria berberidis CBS 394.84]KAF1845166.1 hypothetical protein K460DRAFT_283468 [Cucurbitaria berberidis CBS 394.84]